MKLILFPILCANLMAMAADFGVLLYLYLSSLTVCLFAALLLTLLNNKRRGRSWRSLGRDDSRRFWYAEIVALLGAFVLGGVWGEWISPR